MERIDNLVKHLQCLKKGGGIHIKKKNRGKFTDYCGGKVTDECIQRGKNSPNPTIRKRATFAANARKWKHQYGGIVYTPLNTKYTTQLTPAEEQSFRDWYKVYALNHGLDKDPDNLEHYYDYRGYWKNGPEPQSLIFNEHLPDTWKTPGHPTFSSESIYSNKPTIEDLANFTGGFETFRAEPYVLKTESGKNQILAGYGSANPEIIKLAKEGKLTEDIARKEMIRRLKADYDEWTRKLPEFSQLPEEVKLALVDTSYNGKGVTATIANSPKLINMIKSGVRDGKTLSKEMDHSKTAGSWLGVRSSARRAMAQGKYNWNWSNVDKYGRQVDYNQYKGPEDWKSSPYYNKYQKGGSFLWEDPLVYRSPYWGTDDPKEKLKTLSPLVEDYSNPEFPIESVKPWDIIEVKEQPEVQQEVQVQKPRGITQFKYNNIDVGNFKEFLNKVEEAGISLRVTSGVENRKTKSGKTSLHATGNAIDVTPIDGNWNKLISQFRDNPELIDYMARNGIGVIDETDPAMMARTGATGKHFHFEIVSPEEREKGRGKISLYGFNKLFG